MGGDGDWAEEPLSGSSLHLRRLLRWDGKIPNNLEVPVSEVTLEEFKDSGIIAEEGVERI